jgi:hypothetical protein
MIDPSLDCPLGTVHTSNQPLLLISLYMSCPLASSLRPLSLGFFSSSSPQGWWTSAPWSSVNNGMPTLCGPPVLASLRCDLAVLFHRELNLPTRAGCNPESLEMPSSNMENVPRRPPAPIITPSQLRKALREHTPSPDRALTAAPTRFLTPKA